MFIFHCLEVMLAVRVLVWYELCGEWVLRCQLVQRGVCGVGAREAVDLCGVCHGLVSLVLTVPDSAGWQCLLYARRQRCEGGIW